MTEHFDIAIAGSTPLSGLLAGLLAQTHGLKVGWIGHFLNPLQPQRGFDISVAPVTRPETWALLNRTIPETLRVLGEIGDGPVFERVDPLLLARNRDAAQALMHLRATAQGFGIELEPQPISGSYRTAFRLRDAVRVQRRPLLAALPQWLDAQGVTRFPFERTIVKMLRGGGAQMVRDDETRFAAERLVLAGDAAISAHLPASDVEHYFHRVQMSAVLLEPVAPLPSSVVIHADNGAVIYQRGNGALDCAGQGDTAGLMADALLLAPEGQTTRLAGASRFHGLIGRDGAPVVGTSGKSDAFLIGGLGTTGLFQVPALARLIADAADETETAYFAARAPGPADSRPDVAEYAPVMAGKAARHG